VREEFGGVELGGSVQVLDLYFSLYYWENDLSSNTDSNTMEACNSGTPHQTIATSAVGWLRPSTASTPHSPT
jgi:hypothetical protein